MGTPYPVEVHAFHGISVSPCTNANGQFLFATGSLLPFTRQHVRVSSGNM